MYEQSKLKVPRVRDQATAPSRATERGSDFDPRRDETRSSDHRFGQIAIWPNAGEHDANMPTRRTFATDAGRPLDEELRLDMERTIGRDLSAVRIHRSRAVGDAGARAITQGTRISFAPGEFQPSSPAGQKLLRHELVHVRQQSDRRVGHGVTGLVDDPDLEAEAERIARRPPSSGARGDLDVAVAEPTSGTPAPMQPAAKDDEPSLTPAERRARAEEKVREARRAKLAPLDRFRNDELVEAEFVTPEHKESIAKFAEKKNLVLSVRDTGSHSLERIKQGAKPKPHKILEKSIKASSLADHGHVEAAEALKRGDEELPDIDGVSLHDLKGFVGHWQGDDERLLGLRVDAKDVLDQASLDASGGDAHQQGLAVLQQFLAGTETDQPYIPLENFAAFREAMPDDRWKQFLYTGDYDLHEVYQHKRALPEATPEKARLLTGINDTIASDQEKRQPTGGPPLPIRSGKISVSDPKLKPDEKDAGKKASPTVAPAKKKPDLTPPMMTLHADSGSQYAMIQHGDQAGYITNQIHENRAKGAEASAKAPVNAKVGREHEDQLAWCVNGEWFVTNGPEEHAAFRDAIGVIAPSGWSAKFQRRLEQGELRTVSHG